MYKITFFLTIFIFLNLSVFAQIPKIEIIERWVNKIQTVDLSPDNTVIATVLSDSSFRSYDIFSSKQLHVYNKITDFSQKPVFSADSKNTAVICRDNSVRVYDLKSGKEKQVLIPDSKLREISFCYGDRNILANTFDSTSYLYSVSTGELLSVFKENTKHVTEIISKGRAYVMVADPYTAELYNFNSGKQLKVFGCENGLLNCADFSPDGKFVLVACDSSAALYDIEMARFARIFEGYSRLNSAYYSSDGKYLILNGDSLSQIFKISNGKELKVFTGNASFSPDAKYLIVNSFDKVIYDIKSRLAREYNPGKKGQIFLSKDSRFYVVSDQNKLSFFESKSGKLLYSRIQYKSNEWLVYDADGRFDCSPDFVKNISFSCGLKVVVSEIINKSLYLPDLAGKIMRKENLENLSKLKEFNICAE